LELQVLLLTFVLFSNKQTYRKMERDELASMIMRRIYTRRMFAEALAEDIINSFNTTFMNTYVEMLESIAEELLEDYGNDHLCTDILREVVEEFKKRIQELHN
jgi:hypothetical protein